MGVNFVVYWKDEQNEMVLPVGVWTVQVVHKKVCMSLSVYSVVLSYGSTITSLCKLIYGKFFNTSILYLSSHIY